MKKSGNKLRIGIIFGGFSREREVSFAGGRTVYDNLNKSLFEPIPIFVDSFGNFAILDWKYIYKGSIRDFYPPVSYLPPTPNEFQVYAESLKGEDQLKMLKEIGTPIKVDELRKKIDFAFLCLHGAGGEDGSIQGLFDYYKMPYSGSGIYASALGMNKTIQREWMQSTGLETPDFIIVKREDALHESRIQNIYKAVKTGMGIPCVIKPANQGSSIGASVLMANDYASFEKALLKSFFIEKITAAQWKAMKRDEQVAFVRTLSDIREGIGFPMNCFINETGSEVYHPEELLKKLTTHFAKSQATVTLQAFDGESESLIESFIRGKEFSCIVVQDENGKPIALPPTEIRKGQELFDYRSKYLPGLSHKITPIDLPSEQIERISNDCCKLFTDMHFNVYARIDGFISNEGKIYLNDPNTTSGMLPSSFFFHQAAEIGLNPSQFLTYIIHTSIKQRLLSSMHHPEYSSLLVRLKDLMRNEKSASQKKKKIGVIFGGYSSERHISVESGRNIYEKLSSSSQYEPLPIFLSGNAEEYALYQVPINVMLKDNADDIKEKIEHYKVHPFIKKIQANAKSITDEFATGDSLMPPRKLTFKELAKETDAIFIALHGRPGEDGTIQKELSKVNLPFNGSSSATSSITINKYETNRLLEKKGLLVPGDVIVKAEECRSNTSALFKGIEKKLGLPFIAKPIDDGCSSAVKKIHNQPEFDAYVNLIFRSTEEKDKQASKVLKIKPNEEFPVKPAFLAEELVRKKGASHLLEITGGLLTHANAGKVGYEMFEASEALSEGEVLSLEEKFLAGEGQNITPARYAKAPALRQKISDVVKAELKKAAVALNIEGYARIDAFVRVYNNGKVEVVFIEVNSLPGMTPATCIFHQTAINGYTPYKFIDSILQYGFESQKRKKK